MLQHRPGSMGVRMKSEYARCDVDPASHGKSAYRDLLIMAVVHVAVMYAIMFSMVYSLNEVVHNLNTLYMAGMMAVPMVVLMPLFMRKMYPNRKLNIALYIVAMGVFVTLFAFTRDQSFIGDKQFLKSMIPHHSGAVLMCERAELRDAEVVDLCNRIIESQKAEIAQMNNILGRM